MLRFFSLLLAVILCVCALPVSAEDISEKSSRPAVTATAEPAATAAPVMPNVVIVNSHKTGATAVPQPTATPVPAAVTQTPAPKSNVVVISRATAVPQPTATPVPAELAANFVQDPVAFSEGSVSFYSDETNAYCHRINYLVNSGSAADFAKAYADMCMNHPSMTYLEHTVSPTGWNYYCFVPAAGKSYDVFSTSSGEWSTGNLCLSISYHKDSSYVTLRWSLDLDMGDLGYRISAPVSPVAPVSTPTAVPQPAATPVPAAFDAHSVQDPIAFSEGSVSLYSNDDSTYCHLSHYQVTGGSAADFVAAYAEMCKGHPALTFLEFTEAPSGWKYYCFTSSAGNSFDSFMVSGDNWTTASLCLAICYKDNNPYITLRWSYDLEMADLGCRISSTSAPAPVQTAVTGAELEALKDIWLSDSQYYYNQLSDQHKKAFEVCISNALAYPNQHAAPQSNYYKALTSMLLLDNPRLFWIDWIDINGLLRYCTGSIAEAAHYDSMQLPQGKTLADLKETFLAAIPQAVSQIRSTLPENASDRDTVKAIRDWLCKNNTYNDAQTSSHKAESDPASFAYLAAHSAYSALIPGDDYEPVCEGYARAFRLLCEEFGIEAISVSGDLNDDGHEWNYVRLSDNQWYFVDVTSDDATSSYSYFLLNAAQAARLPYKLSSYLSSSMMPESGYSEGAAFTFPELAK